MIKPLVMNIKDKFRARLVKEYLYSNIYMYCKKFYRPNRNFLIPFEKDKKFISKINEKVNSNNFFTKRKFESIYELSIYRNFIYNYIRDAKPSLVLETGVLHGLTTSWILKALLDNKKGKLISVDIKRADWKKYFGNKKMGPGYEPDLKFPNYEASGWIVPDYLKKNWKLIYGPSKKILPKINKKVDLFIHDSDHSYSNVKYEINWALKNNPNTSIIIDNYDMNSYSFEFLSKKNKDYYNPKYNYCLINEVNEDLKYYDSAILIKKI